MNKKIIFLGVMVLAIACLFPPVGSFWRELYYSHPYFDGWRFIFNCGGGIGDEGYTGQVFLSYFAVEVVGILFCTLGLAYVFNGKNTKKSD